VHPILKDGVNIGTFQYDDEDPAVTHYYAENAEGEEFEITEEVFHALLHADGTRPLALPDKGRRILPALKRRGLVQTSRFVREKHSLFNRIILLPFGSRVLRMRRFFCILNAALFLLFAPIFAIGLYFMISGSLFLHAEHDFSSWLFYAFLACSLVLHEMGHMTAGLAYGYDLYDVGILLLGIFPVGAYVSHGDKKDAAKGAKIQFSLAGIEANLLIAGICLLLAVQGVPCSPTLLATAEINIVLAAINLLPTAGLDGESALSAVCGVKNISVTAKRWLTSKQRRRELLRAGLPGLVWLSVFALVRLARAAFWAFLGFDLVCILRAVFRVGL